MNGAQLLMAHSDSSGLMSGPPAMIVITFGSTLLALKLIDFVARTPKGAIIIAC
jgi:hypothetical protein